MMLLLIASSKNHTHCIFLIEFLHVTKETKGLGQMGRLIKTWVKKKKKKVIQ